MIGHKMPANGATDASRLVHRLSNVASVAVLDVLNRVDDPFPSRWDLVQVVAVYLLFKYVGFS